DQALHRQWRDDRLGRDRAAAAWLDRCARLRAASALAARYGRAMNTNILFGTPIVISDLPDAATLNAALGTTIFAREKSHPGTQHSNLGGWQSDWEMDCWGGASAIKLLAIGRNTANRIT